MAQLKIERVLQEHIAARSADVFAANKQLQRRGPHFVELLQERKTAQAIITELRAVQAEAA